MNGRWNEHSSARRGADRGRPAGRERYKLRFEHFIDSICIRANRDEDEHTAQNALLSLAVKIVLNGYHFD